MRLCLFLFFSLQLMADVTIQEKSVNGAWLEATINDDQHISKLAFADGSCVIYEYEDQKLCKIARLDSLGRELYAQTYEWNGSKLMSQTGWFTTQYIYDDDNSRIVAKLNPWYQASIEYNSAGKAIRIGDKTYSYDAFNQITEEAGYFHAAYDETCNPMELNGNTIAVDGSNRMIGYDYDAHGNLLRPTFVYNEADQLIEACGERYSYDSYGRRIQSGDTCYLYLGCEEIASFTNSYCNTLKIPGIGGPVAIEIDGRPYAPVVDAQGVIRKLIDPVTNSVYRENDCDIFGDGLTDAIPYAYRGKRYDAKTGLVYFGRRYYDPSLHRWLTPDPLGPIDHENLYQYVYNNPLEYCDPTGGSFWGYVLGLGEIAVGGAIMAGGVGLELATFGGFTFGFTVVEGAGFALMADGLTRTTIESRDMRLPRWDKSFHNSLFKRSVDSSLPLNPAELLKDPKWQESSHPNAREKGHRTFENKETGEKLRYDEGKAGEVGHKGESHWHRFNPDSTGDIDKYLDIKGNPVHDGHPDSHLYPKEVS